MKREHWLYLAAAGCGAAIWILIAQVSGRNEAWDSNLYFSVGIPAVCLVSMAFAFFEPNRSWRWGVLPMVGQDGKLHHDFAVVSYDLIYFS